MTDTYDSVKVSVLHVIHMSYNRPILQMRKPRQMNKPNQTETDINTQDKLVVAQVNGIGQNR